MRECEAASVHVHLARRDAICARGSGNSCCCSCCFLCLPLVLFLEARLCNGQEEGTFEAILPAMSTNQAAVSVVERADGRAAVIDDIAADLFATARVACAGSLDTLAGWFLGGAGSGSSGARWVLGSCAVAGVIDRALMGDEGSVTGAELGFESGGFYVGILAFCASTVGGACGA